MQGSQCGRAARQQQVINHWNREQSTVAYPLRWELCGAVGVQTAVSRCPAPSPAKRGAVNTHSGTMHHITTAYSEEDVNGVVRGCVKDSRHHCAHVPPNHAHKHLCWPPAAPKAHSKDSSDDGSNVCGGCGGYFAAHALSVQRQAHSPQAFVRVVLTAGAPYVDLDSTTEIKAERMLPKQCTSMGTACVAYRDGRAKGLDHVEPHRRDVQDITGAQGNGVRCHVHETRELGRHSLQIEGVLHLCCAQHRDTFLYTMLRERRGRIPCRQLGWDMGYKENCGKCRGGNSVNCFLPET